MPLVAKGSQAPTPTRAPTPVSVQPTPIGPLSAISGGPSSIHALTPIQAVAPHPLAHDASLPGFIGAPVNRLLQAASAPVMAVGSLASGHPLEAVRHIAAIPADVASIAVPQLKDLYNRIPGLKEHEFVLPSQAFRKLGILPGGTLGSVLGFGADVLADPLTYVGLPGGGSIGRETATALGARLARAEEKFSQVVGARTTAEKLGLPVPAHHFSDYTRALTDVHEAQDALRKARAPGARLTLGLQGFGPTKEVGVIPGSAAISRGAKAVGRKAAAHEGLNEVITKFQRDFLTGGLERNTPAYRAATQTRRVLNTYQQGLMREVQKFDGAIRQTVVKMGKSGHTDPTGKAWTLGSAYEQMIHHIEQPTKYALPQALTEHIPAAKKMLDRLAQVENGHGINFAPLTHYVPHRLRTIAERDRFLADNRIPETTAARTPFFVKEERFPTVEAMQGAGYDAETNLAKLLQARVRAHTSALQEVSLRRSAAERAGIKPPSPVDVPGIAALRGISDESDAALRELQRPTDLGTYREAVTSRLAQRRGAELGLRVAKRPAPALAARERAGRILAERVGTRAEAQVAARGAVRADEPTAIRQTRQALRTARTAAERARKTVVKADRSADPLAMRQAHTELRAAQRAHIEARIAHARAQGTFKGTVSQVRIATRKAGVARSRLNLALSDQQKVEKLRADLARLPGREASPDEWKAVHKGFDEMGTRYGSVGLPGAKGRVKVPEAEMKVIAQVKEDIGRSFPDPNSSLAAMNFLKKLTGHWKVLALVSPGYHLRNAYGDSIGAWWAGARNPASFIQAARIIKNQDNPEKLRAMKIRVGSRTLNGEDVLRESGAMGIHGQGFIAVEAGDAAREFAEERSKLAQKMAWTHKVPGLRHVPGEGPASRISGKVGQMREDSTRLGTYLDLRKQGKSIVDAAEKTHTFLFDYGHVSRFVGEARRFWMPFITYTSKAVPRTLKQAATRPGYFSHHAELANALSTAAGIAPGGPSNLPVGQRSAFGIPDPGGILHRILGMPADQPIIWNPQGISPWGSLNSLDPTQIQRGPVSNLLNPFVKTAAELGTGHRFFYAGNAPQRSVAPPLIGALHSLGIPIPNFGPKLSQAVGHDVGGYSSTLDELLRNLPAFSMAAGINPEDPEGMRRSLASYLGGLPLQSYDRAQLIANAQKYGG